MKRLHAMCLAYNTYEMVKRAIVQFEEQAPKYSIASRTLVDQRYPNDGDINTNAENIIGLAEKHGWNYVRPAKNTGAHGGWNWTIRELGLGQDDVLMGVDPDGNPQQPKYLDAIMDVFNNAPECFTVQLNRPCVYAQGLPRTSRLIGKTEVLDYHQPVAWSLGAFECGWLNRVGGMQSRHNLYGYCELDTIQAMRPFGAKWYIVKDFYDEHMKAPDEKYIDWKLACAEGRTYAQFEDWLKIQGNYTLTTSVS